MNNKFRIREAGLQDAPEINLINRTSLKYDLPVADTEKKLANVLLKDYYKIYVCTDENDKAVGYIQLQDYEATYFRSTINVLALAVLEEYRGQGIGKALLKNGEEYAASKGYDMIRLNSGAERGEAHKFYEHLGYDCLKMQKCFVKDL